jgi:GNAT superfamily N-acetyltransferase
VTDRYSITQAASRHLDGLDVIELAAAQLLRGHAPRAVLEQPLPRKTLAAASGRGHLWVALDADAPVGFAQVEMLADDLPHLNEIDVHPAHGRRGLGTRLVRAVCDWVEGAGHDQITLTTFRHVPWNMPWYARLGFVELPAGRWRDELRRLVVAETARGLDPVQRVAMSWSPRRVR